MRPAGFNLSSRRCSLLFSEGRIQAQHPQDGQRRGEARLPADMQGSRQTNWGSASRATQRDSLQTDNGILNSSTAERGSLLARD